MRIVARQAFTSTRQLVDLSGCSQSNLSITNHAGDPFSSKDPKLITSRARAKRGVSLNIGLEVMIRFFAYNKVCFQLALVRVYLSL